MKALLLNLVRLVLPWLAPKIDAVLVKHYQDLRHKYAWLGAKHGEEVEPAFRAEILERLDRIDRTPEMEALLEADARKLAAAEMELAALRQDQALVLADVRGWLERTGGEVQVLQAQLTGAAGRLPAEHAAELGGPLGMAKRIIDDWPDDETELSGGLTITTNPPTNTATL